MLSHPQASQVAFDHAPPVVPERDGRPIGLVSYRNIGVIVAAFDVIIILFASLAGGVSYHIATFGQVGDIAAFAGIGANAALVFVLFMRSRGLYRTQSFLSRNQQFRGTVFAWTFVLLAITALLFLFKVGEEYSRGAIVSFGIIGFALLLGSRAVIAARLPGAFASGRLRGTAAVVIGDRDELARSPASQLLERYGASEVGRFELPSPRTGDLPSTRRQLAIIDAAIEATRKSQAERVLLVMPWSDTLRRTIVCERLRLLPLPVYLLPDRSVSSILSLSTRQPGADVAIELQRAPLSLTELAVKRIFDIVLGGLSLIMLAPLLVVVSIAIKLESRGPVMFRQHRKGFNDAVFAIYKFRTMVVQENGAVIRQAQPDDRRVTRVGRILRQTSIDELPQFLNVLRGDMSIVGPRPHAVAHNDEYSKLIASYAFRHHVKPGITGWAQVNGWRGATTDLNLMKRRIEHDLWYINNWSMWLDLWIVLRTSVELLRQRNAY